MSTEASAEIKHLTDVLFRDKMKSNVCIKRNENRRK